MIGFAVEDLLEAEAVHDYAEAVSEVMPYFVLAFGFNLFVGWRSFRRVVVLLVIVVCRDRSWVWW